MVLLAATLSVSMIAGCGSKGDNNTDTTKTESKQDSDQEAADKVAKLIDDIYVQERTDKTDEQCTAAKEAWDALTDAQKELVEGENADPDYFGRDTGDASKDDPLNADEIGENEILVVSFGTSFNDSRATDIGGIEKAVQAAYPDWSVRRAFTAQIIINHVQARDGEKIDNVDQALQRAVDNEVKNLVVQPTHLMHGAEYDELTAALEGYKDKFESVKIAEPLLGEVGADATVINADGSTYTSSMTDLLDWCDTLVVVSDNSGLNVAKAHYNNNYTGTPYNLVDYVEKADASKTTVVISANKPYDVQMYPNADAIMAVYGSKGDPTEQLIGGATGSTSASGPNITAGVEVAFGVFGASGKLPVSIPKYVLTTTAAGEVGSFSNEILYDNGYGITYDAKVIDRDTLANRVAELEKLEKGNYTDASWSVFEIALKNAQEVLNKVSSQEDLDDAFATLNKAYKALTENKKEEPTNPSDKKDESTNKKDETVKTETKKNTQKSKVKTGDNTAITAFAVMMFISGCVFVLARRKRND